MTGSTPAGSQRAFYVTGGSSDITIDGGYAVDGSSLTALIEVGGTTSDVTVSRMSVQGRNPIEVDPGASGVVITGNTLEPNLVNTWGVLVNGAPGTDVTGHTISNQCSGGISVEGASTGVSVENNIVQPTAESLGGDTCAAATGISVSADSETGFVVDYNLIDPSAGEPLYDWGGTSYTSLAAFQAASTRARTTSRPTLG